MATVAGLFNTRSEAQDAIEQLRLNGIDVNNISVAMQDKTQTREIVDQTGAGSGAVGGAVTGGILGGVLGLVLGAGLLAIPGIGPIVAAGPIAAGITGLVAGGATGGIVGALVDAGVPHEEAEVYSTGLQRGGVLVTANVAADQATTARQILDNAGALDETATGGRFRENTDYRLGDETVDVRRRKDSGAAEAVSGGASAIVGGVVGAAVAGPLGAAAGAAIGAAAGAGAAHVADGQGEVDTNAGTMSGGAGGALAGGAIGGLVGGPVGAVIGAGIGAAGGAAAGDKATQGTGSGTATGGVAGGTAGGVIGGLVGGPVGAVAGAAIGATAGAGSAAVGETVADATDRNARVDDSGIPAGGTYNTPVETVREDVAGAGNSVHNAADRAADAMRGTADRAGNAFERGTTDARDATTRATDAGGYVARRDEQVYDADTMRDSSVNTDENFDPDQTRPLPRVDPNNPDTRGQGNY